LQKRCRFFLEKIIRLCHSIKQPLEHKQLNTHQESFELLRSHQKLAAIFAINSWVEKLLNSGLLHQSLNCLWRLAQPTCNPIQTL